MDKRKLENIFLFYQKVIFLRDRYEKDFNKYYQNHRIEVSTYEVISFDTDSEQLTAREFCHQFYKNKILPEQEKTIIQLLEYLNEGGSLESLENFITDLNCSLEIAKRKTYYLKNLYENLIFSLKSILEDIKSVPPYNKEYKENLEFLREEFPVLSDKDESEIPVSEIIDYLKEKEPSLLPKKTNIDYTTFKADSKVIEPVINEQTGVTEIYQKTTSDFNNMPFNMIREYLMPLTKKNKNGQPYLSIDEFNKFFNTVFVEGGTLESNKLEINLYHGERKVITPIFYNFYNKSLSYEKTNHCKKKYVKLLTDNFSNFEYKKVHNCFNRYK